MDFLISLAVSFINQLLKRWFAIEDDNNHISLVILALLFSFWKFGLKWLPEIYVTSIVEIWAIAILEYEVLLKRSATFRGLGGRK